MKRSGNQLINSEFCNSCATNILESNHNTLWLSNCNARELNGVFTEHFASEVMGRCDYVQVYDVGLCIHVGQFKVLWRMSQANANEVVTIVRAERKVVK